MPSTTYSGNIEVEEDFLGSDWQLAKSESAPEALAQQCRDAIDRDAPPTERENLLAVVQVFAKLRYDDVPEVFAILGAKHVVIESPLIDEIVSEAVSHAQIEARQQSVFEFLNARFGTVMEDDESPIRSVSDPEILTHSAAACDTLQSFRIALSKVSGR